MEERKWEDMSEDCLVNIFGRVELESRLLDIPLVCKTWFRAVRNPICYQELIFPSSLYCESRLWTKFIALTRNSQLIYVGVGRSQRCATSLVLPSDCTREELIYVSEEYPALKKLVILTWVLQDYEDIIPRLIVKWKKLEFLTLGSASANWIREIFELILIQLRGLCFTSGCIDDGIALAIVELLPKLKFVIINHAQLQKENLLLIMRGCKELECLDVQKCLGFHENDEEIEKLSSAINNFRSDGAKAEGSYDYFSYSYCYDPYYSDPYEATSNYKNRILTSGSWGMSANKLLCLLWECFVLSVYII